MNTEEKHLQESGEMYLETILILSQRMEHVRSIDICEYRSYSKPSVSRAVNLLKDRGYINISTAGYITLTEKGDEAARKIYERHQILTKVLVAMGIDPVQAEEDACRIEHVISDETFDKIKEYVRAH